MLGIKFPVRESGEHALELPEFVWCDRNMVWDSGNNV